MQYIPKLFFVLNIAAAYGASVGTIKRELELTNLAKNETEGMSKEVVLEYDPLSPNDNIVATSTKNNYEVGIAIAEVAKRTVDLLSKMDLTEQGWQSLVQLVVTLVSLYLGPYTQVIMPMLSGIAAVVSKSLT